MTLSRRKILVAMSGGVDSSVAAALLAREGHEVIGVTMRLLPRGGEGFGCCGSPEDLLLAKRSAERAGVPHYVLDYYPDFQTKVVDYFVDSYLAGETPNPCLACNRYIKFDKLAAFAESVNATHVATGHYARVIKSETGYRLFEAAYLEKDQSYVLYNFTQKGLAHTLFPVGDAPKPRVRDLAREFELPNADKKESMEICFVPNRDYRGFVEAKLDERQEQPNTAKSGPIRNAAGDVIGEHRGIAFYTIGQRSGLGLTTKEPVYVTRLDPKTNTVYVGTDRENGAAGLDARDATWIAGTPPADEFDALVKIRYKHEPAPARVRVTEKGFVVSFVQPQRAVTPGQAAVLYRWDEKIKAREVLGGGTITASVSHETVRA